MVGYRPTFLQAVRRWIIKYSAEVYLGGIALMTLLLEIVIFSFLSNSNPFFSNNIIFNCFIAAYLRNKRAIC